jgi:hypothetical protein
MTAAWESAVTVVRHVRIALAVRADELRDEHFGVLREAIASSAEGR